MSEICSFCQLWDSINEIAVVVDLMIDGVIKCSFIYLELPSVDCLENLQSETQKFALKIVRWRVKTAVWVNAHAQIFLFWAWSRPEADHDLRYKVNLRSSERQDAHAAALAWETKEFLPLRASLLDWTSLSIESCRIKVTKNKDKRCRGERERENVFQNSSLFAVAIAGSCRSS